MTPIMWWGLIASDFLAKPAKLASRWRHNFSLVPELQMKPVSKVVQYASSIGVILRSGIDCYFSKFKSTVEIIH